MKHKYLYSMLDCAENKDCTLLTGPSLKGARARAVTTFLRFTILFIKKNIK